MPIRCNHQDSPDQERPWPSETEKERDSEIANDVVELPTEVRARHKLLRQCENDVLYRRAQRGVIVLVAMRTQNGPIRLFKQQFTLHLA